ncbi:dihydroxyacetone kinase subunit DhaK [Lentibacillus sp. CBA3610]|uniref:dihydroxyacetone kinase subunit DhaK n=1 Tax=Lentibacillus sp. CBA3610 TaxID=2518176 RepID=UPI001594F2A4|nr:dihydroxyacetone kinase subunit DhaK [Lentibacillus sp. CBA3610]QKY69906.1 dihydroxyacetone kinase subunit DhaK [Lentibacillus sp. CBA3610]
MKKILNDPNQVLQDMTEGLAAAYPNELKQLSGTTVIAKKDAPIANKVGIVSGGGSGHEPAHAGYVGKGMLDAAVAGEVFTSPAPDQVFEAIKAADSGSGVLLVIKNYTGDVLNFEMAQELAEAEGITVDKVIVKDDVAAGDQPSRRGIAGTIFVHKIAGAKAEKGRSLEEVKAAAEKTIQNVRSMGMALSPCTVPAAGEPSFQLDENEMEIGIGIHGESGIERKEIATANDIANELTEKVLNDFDFTGEAAVMVNGLGSTPEMELYIVNKKVQAILAEKGINVYKTFVGEYMTSLEMAGCSVTLLKLDDELKTLLDEPSHAPAFRI